MATAGTETTIVEPYVYYAPRLTPIPGPKHGYRTPLAAPWVRLENFDDENAVVVDFNNPKIRVRTQDHGVIATNPSSDDAITISLATQTPSGDILTKALSLVEFMAAAVTSAVAEVQTLTLTAGVTTNGTLRVTLNGDSWDLAVLSASHATPANLATFMRTAGNYTPVGSAGSFAAKWAATGSGNDVIYTAQQQEAKNGTFALVPNATGAAGNFVETTPGVSTRPKITSWWFDPNANKNFMLLIEGVALAGGIFETDTKVYFVAYNVEPGEQAGGRGGGGGGGGGGRRGGGGGGGGRRGQAQPGQITMNYKGENAHLQVALELDVQPEPGIATVFQGQPQGEGNWPSGGIDPFKRANFWNVDSIA